MRVCVDCGTVWPDDVARKWGETKETTGYGPRPVCVALVPIPRTNPPAGQVCRGPLVYTSELQLEEQELLVAADAEGKGLPAPARREARQLTAL